MDVDSFITKYRPDWQRLEQAVGRGRRSLTGLEGGEVTEIVHLYLKASSHLAEVQTRYRDHRLETYLTQVVARAHAAIYGSRPRTLRGFLAFFGYRYRSAIRRTAPHILVMSVLFIGLWALVAFWVAGSSEAEAGLLPPDLREAVRRIERRAAFPFSPATISAAILTNNLRVAFLAFALGISLGIGTIFVLVTNALFLGSVSGAAHSAGTAGIFWSLVLPHGFLEIVAICIAAGAGFRLGWSIVDPGDRPRSTALAEEARDSVLVVLGVIPAFAVAALIEGFVTGSFVPSWLQIALGAVVAAGYVAFLFGRGVQSLPKALMRR
ncbi:MAG: stage II sporulation protein M [Actinomycetota bacterium]